jgi:transposase-like protein
MVDVCCKACGGGSYIRNGIVRGHQRYKCKDCGCHFTDTPPRGKPAGMKALAVLLYSMGNASFGMIGRLLGVSDVSVYNWVRAEGEALSSPEVPGDVRIVAIDEMWHFLKKSLKNSGSGAPLTLCSGEPWPGLWVGVMMQPVKGSSTPSD